MHDPTSKRVFTGMKDTGEPFAILYRADGVTWKHGAEAAQYVEAMRPQPSGDGRATASEAASPEVSAVEAAMNVAAGFAGPVASVAFALSTVLQWWEQRKHRQMGEASFEEERRIPWTYDMIRRWVHVHEGGGALDLQISHFLAREALATLAALVDTPKMAVPQALLYDLEQIRHTVSSLRRLLAAQFRALEEAQSFNASAFVSASFAKLGQSSDATINYPWIRELCGDPEEDWDVALANKQIAAFQKDLADLGRNSRSLSEMAFSYSVPEAEIKADKDLLSWSSPFMTGLGLATSVIPSCPSWSWQALPYSRS